MRVLLSIMCQYWKVLQSYLERLDIYFYIFCWKNGFNHFCDRLQSSKIQKIKIQTYGELEKKLEKV